jgi:predicted TIM-barrel fold metal-dependent hydrolase
VPPARAAAARARSAQARRPAAPHRGVWIEVGADPGQYLQEGSYAAGLAERDPRIKAIVADICVRHHQLAAAVELVRRCPEVRFVLDHLGKPAIHAGLLDPWRHHIKGLSELPNVHCKLSGVITEADPHTWTRAHLRPYLNHVIACFGFDRLHYASDWPVSEQIHRYPAWVTILDDLTTGCSATELRNLFRDNALAFYRPESRHSNH